jgi:zinc protease
MEERRMRTTDNPVSALFELINATAYVAHPYQWPIIGWMDDIRQATSSDAERYFHTYYQPNNAVVIAVGDFDSAELAAEIAKQFGSIPSGDSPPPVRSIEPQQQGERSVVLRREAQLPFIGIAYHTPNLHSPDAAAIEMLAAVLSGGKSARLYEQLVYRRQIARDVGANSDYTSMDPGIFTVYAQPLPGKKVSEVRQALLTEIEKIRDKAPSAREVEKARNGIEAGFVFAQDSLFYQGMLLGQYEMAGDWRLIDKYLPAIRAVTAEDIRRVAAVYLIADNRTMGVLEPLPSKTAQPAPAALPPHGMVR